MPYFSFIKQQYRALLFGFLFVFVGNYGQTFFISLFGAEWRHAFELTHQELGLYYSLVTLASGITLLFVGGKLDNASLKTFSLWILAGSFVGMILLATSAHIAVFLLGLLLIRFCGQGLSTHTAFTSMARYFDQNRGKATSIAAMGMPIGELILPIIAASLILTFGWRYTWLSFAGFLILALVPAILWSLKADKFKSVLHSEKLPSTSNQNTSLNSVKKTSIDELDGQSHWTRSQVVKDWRFIAALVALMAPAVIITGLFFHQLYWAEQRGWSLTAMASSLSAYAITHALGSLYTGSLVDRIGAQRVLRLYLLPFVIALVGLLFDSYWGWLWFMTISGVSVGGSGPTFGALWPDVYGTQFLGGIRAMVSGVMVISTSITPFVLGIFIDRGVSVLSIMLAMLVYAAIAFMLCQVIYRNRAKV
ncbi:MAG: MFS transporter [Gammaproteobacteria bacterium]|nr:MFS transporter [Gammaproteobacteria bacterium]